MTIRFILQIVLTCGLLSLSLSAVAELNPPDIACRYETKVTPSGKKPVAKAEEAWFFWRQGDMIQTRDADGDHGEIWQKTATGAIQYRKLYHQDKTAIEYMPGDQPTNNLNQDWLKLANMLSPQELNELKLVKKTKALGRAAELRRGEKDGKAIEVVWLIDEQLPASLIRKDQSGSVELRLTALSPAASAPWQAASPAEIANYRHIDAVDFGDMENDPFVKKVMAQEGHHHHH